MKIAVVGIGYVGLSVGVVLAQNNTVVATDLDASKVASINQGQSPIRDEEAARFLASGSVKLTATSDLEKAVKGAKFVVVSTPTDYDPAQNFFDTQSVEEVAKRVLELNPAAIVVIKSTVPVGFTEGLKLQLGTENIIFSPEFLREGRAVLDNLYPARIVVGERSERAADFANLMLQSAHNKEAEVLLTDPAEAEAIKLFSNAYLAMRVSFFNELDSYSMVKGLDTSQIIRGVSSDPRIGRQYNNPSFGYGGYCLPKDTKQLRANFDGIPQNIISAIVEANQTRLDFLADELAKTATGAVGVHRLEMKAGSDNFRQSAVLGLISNLQARGLEVVLYEPLLKVETFENCHVEPDFRAFAERVSTIVSNRWSEDLKPYGDKVFSRDIYGTD